MAAARPPSTRLCVVLALGTAFVACADEAAVPPKEAAPPVQLAPPHVTPPSTAGADRCIDCHEDLVASWSHTGMARSLGPVQPGELEGLGEVADLPAGYHYAYEHGPDGPKLHETRPDAPSHRLTTDVAFAIGSGERDRSYAVQLGGGWWFSPLEVLAIPEGRKTALAPAHMMTSGLRFDSPITNECLGCHTDAPPPPDFPLNVARDEDVWQPRGISCAACHGKVEEHATWQEADLVGETPEGPDPILRASDLSRTERLSVCAACHLQGDARIILSSDELGPPEPGGELLDVRALFVAAEATNEIGFVSQVERLALSACFLESEMTCETCHDPHHTLHEERESEVVRAACTRCHPGGMTHASTAPACASEDSATSGRDCASCHMPLSGTFDVAEVMIHDHFIRVDGSDAPPASGHHGLRVDESATGNWRRFTWPGAQPPSHVDDPGLWLMAYAANGHGPRALDYLDREPGPASAMLPMYHHMRGLLLEGVGRDAEAIVAYRQALALDPTLASSAINLGWALGRAGDTEGGLEVLNEILARFPKAHGALRNRAALRMQLGNEAGFASDLEAAYEERPLADLAKALASYFAGKGMREKAQSWSARARSMDPVSAR